MPSPADPPEGRRAVDYGVPTDPGDRARVPLLDLIGRQALDDGYAVAAARRARLAATPGTGPDGGPGAGPGAGRTGTGGGPRSLVAVAGVVGVLGLLVAIAVTQNRANADVDSASRATLIERIEAERDVRARQERRIATLRERNTALETRRDVLTDTAQQRDVEARGLAVRTGFATVAGEGVRVTVSEPDDVGEPLVRDRDLGLLVNGLWEAGAEAVAVNNRRLTPLTAIRFSAPAIEIGGVGVAAPYTVEAVGDTRTLAARLLETASGQQFDTRARNAGFGYRVENVAELSLPGAALTPLRWVDRQPDRDGDADNADGSVQRGGEGGGAS